MSRTNGASLFLVRVRARDQPMLSYLHPLVGGNSFYLVRQYILSSERLNNRIIKWLLLKCRRRILLSISKYFPSLQRFLVLWCSQSYMGPYWNESPAECAKWLSVCSLYTITFSRLQFMVEPLDMVWYSCYSRLNWNFCRMAMWKHYIFLFGGFYDPGIRSEWIAFQ